MLTTTLVTIITTAAAAVAAPARRDGLQYTLHPDGDETKCLNIEGDASISGSLRFADCGDRTNPNIWFTLSPHGPTLIRGADPDQCISAGLTAYGWDRNYNSTYVTMSPCPDEVDPCGNGLTWQFDGDKLRQTGADQCINSKLTIGKSTLFLTSTCDDENPDQFWTVSR